MKINKKEFEENGYLVLPKIVSKSSLLKLNKNADKMINDFKKSVNREQSNKNNRKKFGEISQNGKIFFANQCEYYSHINAYAKGKFIKKIVSKLLGNKIYLFNEQLVNKNPNTPSSFSWHQDSGYIHFKHKPYISVWLALTDTTEKNGSLSIIPTNLKKIKNATLHKWKDTSKDLGINVNEKKSSSGLCKCRNFNNFFKLNATFIWC